ncbi:GNAT family N-acetyltransferase [Clostridium sp. C2-6-12]|uniref:GNAT family N-acetyltransferase n=1 Tax=Clostridium sp. C2-6-12 TaxID=2698832 RepID=UPI0013689112|nr:GNAT family N-acetyltransferase [Clostridium sp. C2-6-12]
MVINTERLVINPIKENDYEDICEYGCDEEVGQYMIYWPKTKQEIREFISTCTFSMSSENPMWYEFAMRLKENSKVIGNIGMIIKDSEAEIGWISNKKYWNKGYMSEAVNAVIDGAFNKLSIDRIVATCTDKNIGSYKVMEKCNMARVSFEKDHKAMRKGIEVTYDKLTYAIDKY